MLAHDPPLGHITTFGGHPLSCAAGMAALKVIVRDRLPETAAQAGAEIIRRLRGLNAPEIAAVRGLGRLDRSGIPHRRARPPLGCGDDRARRNVNWTLNADAVVRIAPPLTIAPAEIDFGLNAMKEALDAIRR